MQNKILSWAGLTVIAISAFLDTRAQAHITETYSERTNNYDSIDSGTRGKLKEIVHTFFDGKEYKFELVNDRLSDLYVNEVKIPEADFDKYKDVIVRIRKQIAIDRMRDPGYELMKVMIDDLVRDGIVADHKSLMSVTLSSTEMTVNDIKQSDAVHARYKEKFSSWAAANFSYGGNKPSYQGFHLRRLEGL